MIPAGRRRGYGTLLPSALEEQLADVEQVFLTTAKDGEAQAFYESSGHRAARRQGVMIKQLITPA